MQPVIDFFAGMHPAIAALIATTGTWLLTTAGAALVFLFGDVPRRTLDGMLGFTGGVMVAASFWSLLAPAIEMTEGEGFARVMPAAIGFLGGALFLFALDRWTPHLHLNFGAHEAEGPETAWHKTTLLVLAITLHNIPEGLAVGVLFGGAAAGIEGATAAGAVALAIGIGLQNFPEGLAVSAPLRRHGVSRLRAAGYGSLSAAVEPIAGVIGAVAVYAIEPLLPYALAFAAGAMIFVVVEEVIPETQRDRYTDVATLGFVLGFTVMMALDVGLS